MITGVVGSERRTMLFDTGPEGRAWELNVGRLGVSLHGVEAIHLSHWHRDHSGGMVRALEMITDARGKGVAPVVVDLHPDRPDLRGTRPPGMDTVSLGADPTFEEVEEAGGEVVKIDQPHTVLGGMFATSGEIPRVTEYEQGLRFGVRLREGKWVEDTLLKDERILMCKLKSELNSASASSYI
jgi:7,8-dihydropterin-6-yl-methyl-4-(beta-D-ribofuranosyl)aminobenzene 5'-phosphate synthase